MSQILMPHPLEMMTISGRIGRTMHAILQSRILSPDKRSEIISEAVDAFRRRVDDRLEENAGLWQGEFWGKWVLSAVAAQKYTGDNSLKKAIRKTCGDLIATQDDNGYIGTYSDSGFVIAAPHRFNWNIWCRKYTLWGLIDAYELLRETKILDAAIRFMDHLIQEVGPGAIHIIDTGKFYGLPSTSILLPVVKLYQLTKEKRFLDFAYYIIDQWSLHDGEPPNIIENGLADTPIHTWFPNPENWTKAYEFISCIDGLLQLYRVDGNPTWLAVAQNIHRNIRDYERSIVGGIGKNDKLTAARFQLDVENEICDAVYWMRFSAQLLELTQDSMYGDEIERTLYNLLLASMNAEGTWGLRRVCLSQEHWIAPQHCHLKHHHCCVANAPRGFLLAAQTAVMASDSGVSIILFIPGTYHLDLKTGQTLGVEIATDYPRSGAVVIRIKTSHSGELPVSVRIPEWSRHTTLDYPDATIHPTASRFETITRRWENGDTIELNLDMRGRFVPYPGTPLDRQTFAAVERGPLVLARDIRLNNSEDINQVIPLSPDENGHVVLTEIESHPKTWLNFQTSSGVFLTDFSSAGNTWDKQTSAFRVWFPVR